MFYIKNDECLNEELEIVASNIIDEFETYGCYKTIDECINDFLDYCFETYESFEKYDKAKLISLFNWVIEEE